jgi:gliding motility-associated-like protein
MWASASGGTPPYTFLWSSGHSIDTATNLCAGNYTVTITDAQGCVSISGETLNQPPLLTDQPSVTTLPCLEVCIGTLDPNVSGGTPPYQYLWEDGSTQATANGLCAGPYAITVTDQNGCVIISRDTLEVDWVFKDMEVWASPDTIFRGQQAYIAATNIPGVTYQWEPAFYVVSAGLAETMAFPEQTTTFALSATDSYGCRYTDSLKIWVKDVICREPYIYIPNAFTPNGDQLNDQLYVRSAVAAEMTLMVYDRWGVKVFETKDQQEGWDGNFNGKNCEPGVYVYYLEVRCFDQQIFEKKGNVTLIR